MSKREFFLTVNTDQFPNLEDAGDYIANGLAQSVANADGLPLKTLEGVEDMIEPEYLGNGRVGAYRISIEFVGEL